MNIDIKNVTPLNGVIIVQDDKKEEVSSGGIVIPGSAADDHIVKGQVIATSPYRLENGDKEDPEVSPGNRVLYSFTAGAGNAWDEEGITYRAVRPVEILAIIVE